MKRRAASQGPITAAEHAQMPKYTIGVVSKLLSLPPQALRRYEEAGLLEPARQAGKNRLYSDQDVAVLKEIVQLTDQGVNAVGIRYIIQMRGHVRILQQEIEEAREAQQRAEADRDRAEKALQQAEEQRLKTNVRFST